MDGLTFICGITPKPQAMKHAQQDLALYSKKYRKSKKAEFYGDQDAMVDDYRTFLLKEVDRLRDSYYYKYADIDMTDFSDIVEAMCADFRVSLKLKPHDLVLGMLRSCARGYRADFRHEFDCDIELYKLFLGHKVYEQLPILIQQVYGYGKDKELSKSQQAGLVQLIVDEEIEALRTRHQKEVRV